MRRSTVLILSVILIAPVFLACTGETTGVTADDFQRQREALVAKQKRRAADAEQVAMPENAGLAGIGSLDGFRYIAEGKRDPFRSFILDRLKEMREGPRGPLEQFELSQLELVAVIWGTGNQRALVEDTSGRAYIVEEGTPIGKNEGEVIAIGDNTVTVRETYVDYLGTRTSKEIDLRVHIGAGG